MQTDLLIKESRIVAIQRTDLDSTKTQDQVIEATEIEARVINTMIKGMIESHAITEHHGTLLGDTDLNFWN